MQAVKSDRPATPAKLTSKFISVAVTLIILIATGLVIFNTYKSRVTAPVTTVISQSALEELYGLHVNLVAVTGAGGFVDVRLKIVDGEKAKLLLADPKNFPTLSTATGVILNAPEDTKSQKMRFENNAGMFIMYPNSGNAVQTGTLVTILFGDTALEPISAK